MNARPPVRIDVQLPELTPVQADFLWNLLENIASAIWNAYESDLLDIHNDPSRERGYEDLDPANMDVADCEDCTDNHTAADLVSDGSSDDPFTEF